MLTYHSMRITHSNLDCPKIQNSKLYNRLLIKDRRRESRVQNRSIVEEAESDRGRVLFSAPFRRLQSKAQVFSLETNASVRSRLTHSLEVATVSRQLAQSVLQEFGEEKRDLLGLEGNERAFVTFADAACLIHDIGNPPFGHFGEAAISDWFAKSRENLKLEMLGNRYLDLWERCFKDFESFDGNPQGLRIITRLQPDRVGDLNGLNLTATTIASTIKYPYGSSEAIKLKKKKPGFFVTEENVVEWAWAKLGLANGARHPLSYLMEAADDIAYCFSDLEDGIEKSVIAARDFVDHVREASKNYETHEVFGPILPDLFRFLAGLHDSLGARGASIRVPEERGERKDILLAPIYDVRCLMLRALSKWVAKKFVERHDDILAGDNSPLLDESPGVAFIDVFKSFAIENLYATKAVRQREVTAYSVIHGILEAFSPLMTCDRNHFLCVLEGKGKDNRSNAITVEAGLASCLSRKQVELYHSAVGGLDGNFDEVEREIWERVFRMRLIVDFLSGMTDDYALRLYRLIKGTSIEVI